MRDEGQYDAEKDPGRDHRVEHREVDEAEYSGGNGADQIYALAADPIRQVSGERDRDKRQQPGRYQRRQKEIARRVQNLRAIGKDEGEIDVGWGLLGHSGEGRQDDLLRLALNDFEHWHPLYPLFGDETPEDRRLEDAEPDIEPDCDHDDAEHERDAPAPDEKLVAGNRAEHEYRQIRQQQPGRPAELRPGGDEAAMGVGARPF